jgi:hypothetical protein
LSRSDTKPCASCGRVITWRKAWERDWDQVRYCSEACRKGKVRPVDRDLETAILTLLDARARGASICPSEVARMVADNRARVEPGAEPDPERWRELMEPARRAARRLTARGEVEITQKGRVVDASSAKGPIRVRRPS